MKIEITAKPVFHLHVPLATVDMLFLMSAHHYDERCKAAHRLGGFLYGWMNHATYSPATPISAAWDELDTVLKICENTGVLLTKRNNENVHLICTLVSDIGKAMQHWNRIREDWVTGIDTTPLRA